MNPSDIRKMRASQPVPDRVAATLDDIATALEQIEASLYAIARKQS